MARITRETPDPPNGAIVRDPKSGEATGALKESAQQLVAKIVPTPSRAEKLAALRAGIKWANEHGITRVHSAGGDFEELDLYDELRRPVTADLIGKECVVGLPDGRILVKKIHRSKSRGLFHLYGNFGDPILDTPIDWAARIRSMAPR